MEVCTGYINLPSKHPAHTGQYMCDGKEVDYDVLTSQIQDREVSSVYNGPIEGIIRIG